MSYEVWLKKRIKKPNEIKDYLPVCTNTTNYHLTQIVASWLSIIALLSKEFLNTWGQRTCFPPPPNLKHYIIPLLSNDMSKNVEWTCLFFLDSESESPYCSFCLVWVTWQCLLTLWRYFCQWHSVFRVWSSVPQLIVCI